MPGLRISNWLRGSDWNCLTTFGPESRAFCGTRLKKDSPILRARNSGQEEKGRAPDARPANFQLVAGVRFELTTFGL
jgi:hypothetical protein